MPIYAVIALLRSYFNIEHENINLDLSRRLLNFEIIEFLVILRTRIIKNRTVPEITSKNFIIKEIGSSWLKGKFQTIMLIPSHLLRGINFSFFDYEFTKTSSFQSLFLILNQDRIITWNSNFCQHYCIDGNC